MGQRRVNKVEKSNWRSDAERDADDGKGKRNIRKNERKKQEERHHWKGHKERGTK